jgi:hypothetical protein
MKVTDRTYETLLTNGNRKQATKKTVRNDDLSSLVNNELALQKSQKVKQKSLPHYFIHVPFVSPVSPLFHSWTSYFTVVPFFLLLLQNM